MKEIRAYAKVNLSLNVLEKGETLHKIDTVSTSLDLHDSVKVFFGDAKTHSTSSLDHVIRREANTACKAADLYCSSFNLSYPHIEIVKRIPFGGGFGGSSADASAVLVALNNEYGKTDEETLTKMALEIGSDVPLMLKKGFARATNFGEKLERFESTAELNMLVVTDGNCVSARQSYERFDKTTPVSPFDNDFIVSELKKGRVAYSSFGNMLTSASVSLSNDIQKSIDKLKKTSARAVVMTGSGNGVVAFYNHFAECEEYEELFKNDFEFIKACKSI